MKPALLGISLGLGLLTAAPSFANDDDRDDRDDPGHYNEYRYDSRHYPYFRHNYPRQPYVPYNHRTGDRPYGYGHRWYYSHRIGKYVSRPTKVWIEPGWTGRPDSCDTYPIEIHCLDSRGVFVEGHWENRDEQVWVPGF